MTTWEQRVRDLQNSGWTFARIGLAIGLSLSGVSDIANGHTQSPRGEAAVNLHALHQKVCAKKSRRVV